MAQPDDQNFEDEAKRLLDALERPAGPVPGPSPQPGGLRAAIPWIVIGSLAFGAMASAIAMLLFLKASEPSGSQASPDRPATDSLARDNPVSKQTSPNSTQNPRSDLISNNRSNPVPNHAPNPALDPASNPPSLPVSKKEERPVPPPAPPPVAGVWGTASDYKFGRLPGGNYPHSCAFSQTDSRGEVIISRKTVDYWACRDDGGDSTNGFTVAWADGKTTKYIFDPGGRGSMIGTDGNNYSIAWSNQTRNGSAVIVISHENGSTSWIPGRVN
jgi:hypothetical protein